MLPLLFARRTPFLPLALLGFLAADLSAQGRPVPVEIAQVRDARSLPSLEVVGEVRALVISRLGLGVSGIVETVEVEEGHEVGRGKTLATLDPVPFQTAVDIAQAALDQANHELELFEVKYTPSEIKELEARVEARRAELGLASAERKRIRALHAQRATSDAELEAAESRFDSAAARLTEAEKSLAILSEGARTEEVARQRALVRQREALLAQAVHDKERAVLKAPYPGRIVRRLIAPGEWASQGTIAFEMYDPKSLVIDCRVPAEEMDRIQEGRSATFTVDAYPETRLPGGALTGEVDAIVPWVDATSRAFSVRLRILDGRQRALYPGMVTRASLALNELKDVVSIPRDAVQVETTTDPNARPVSYCWVVDGDRVQRHPVEPIATLARQPGENLVRVACSIGPPKDAWVVVIGANAVEAGSTIQVMAKR